MEKETYAGLEMERVEFDSEDVITESTCPMGDDEFDD